MGQTPGGSLQLVDAASGHDGNRDGPRRRGRFAVRGRNRGVFALPALGRAVPVSARTRSPHHASARRSDAGNRSAAHRREFVPLRLYQLRILAAALRRALRPARCAWISGIPRRKMASSSGTRTEAARQITTTWHEDGNGVLIFRSEPALGIGPNGYLIALPGGNLLFENPAVVLRCRAGGDRGARRRALAGGVAPARLRRLVAGAGAVRAGDGRHPAGGFAVDERLSRQPSLRRTPGTRAGRRTPPHRRSFRRARRPLPARPADPVRGRHGQIPPGGRTRRVSPRTRGSTGASR